MDYVCHGKKNDRIKEVIMRLFETVGLKLYRMCKKKPKRMFYYKNDNGDKVKLEIKAHEGYKRWNGNMSVASAGIYDLRLKLAEPRYINGCKVTKFQAVSWSTGPENRGKRIINLEFTVKGAKNWTARRCEFKKGVNIIEALIKKAYSYTSSKKKHAVTTREIMFKDKTLFVMPTEDGMKYVTKEEWLNGRSERRARRMIIYVGVGLRENPEKNTFSICTKVIKKTESYSKPGYMGKSVEDTRLIFSLNTGAVYARSCEIKGGFPKVFLRRMKKNESVGYPDQEVLYPMYQEINQDPKFMDTIREKLGIDLTWVNRTNDVVLAYWMSLNNIKYPDFIPSCIKEVKKTIEDSEIDNLMDIIKREYKLSNNMLGDIQRKNPDGSPMYPATQTYIQTRRGMGKYWPMFNHELIKIDENTVPYGWGYNVDIFQSNEVLEHHKKRLLKLSFDKDADLGEIINGMDHLRMIRNYKDKTGKDWCFRARNIKELKEEHDLLSKVLRRLDSDTFKLVFDPRFVKKVETKIEDHDVVLMKTWDDFFEQGEAQQNCSFSYHNRYQNYFLLSIRKEGEIKYTASYRYNGDMDQFAAKHNRHAPDLIVDAVCDHVMEVAKQFKNKIPVPKKKYDNLAKIIQKKKAVLTGAPDRQENNLWDMDEIPF